MGICLLSGEHNFQIGSFYLSVDTGNIIIKICSQCGDSYYLKDSEIPQVGDGFEWVSLDVTVEKKCSCS